MQRHRIPLVSVLCLIALYASAHSMLSVKADVDIYQVPQNPQKKASAPDENAKVIDVKKSKKGLKRAGSDILVLKDSVILFHDGAYLYCDSAYLHKEENTFEAFGTVRMEQGDTLFLNGKYMYYDGNTKLVKVRKNVSLEHSPHNKKGVITLFTDSLNYDRMANLGYYFDGGMLVDSLNQLTSFWGQYEPNIKLATFEDSVVLTNPNFTLFSDKLEYDTDRKIAIISTPTTILSDSGTIHTSKGWYNTVNEESLLLDQSKVLNKAGDQTLTGDSIFYYKAKGYGEVFGHMVLHDTTKKVMLFGNYGYYNELEDWAFAADSAYCIEYSLKDSLFAHADTLKLITIIDSTNRVKLNAGKENLVPKKDSLIPDSLIINSPLLTDSTKPLLSTSLANNSLASDSLVKSPLRINKLSKGLNDSIVAPQPADTTIKSYRVIKAYHGVRFYRSDIQGVCDSLQFSSKDSVLRMYKDPILWNTNRQLYGDTINIFMNDSTIDHMHVKGSGFSIEQKDSLHFNQLKSRSLKIRFENKKVKEVLAEGNVETISYPEEKNGQLSLILNLLESSYLKITMKDGAFQRLVAWPKPVGKTTPFHLLTPEQMRLKDFFWYDYLRPLDRYDIFRKETKRTTDIKPKRSAIFDRVDKEFGN